MSVQLAIQPVSPQPGQKLVADKDKIRVSVQITLTCGMPTCAGGRWDPRRFRVTAACLSKEAGAGRSRLLFRGRASEFSGTLKCARPGRHTLVVEALDPETGAAGRLYLEFMVMKPGP